MDKAIRKNIESYDRIAEEYHQYTKHLEKPEIQIREEFLESIKAGGIILELACGPGRDAKFFSGSGYKVVGVDLSKKMIRKARAVAPKARFKLMDFLALNFSNQYFDAVWFNAGLLSVGKRFAPSILNKIHRVLKDGGVLFIGVKEGRGEGFRLDKRYNLKMYYAYYTEREVKDLLIGAGFGIIKIYRPELKSKYHTHQWIGFLCKK